MHQLWRAAAGCHGETNGAAHAVYMLATCRREGGREVFSLEDGNGPSHFAISIAPPPFRSLDELANQISLLESHSSSDTAVSSPCPPIIKQSAGTRSSPPHHRDFKKKNLAGPSMKVSSNQVWSHYMLHPCRGGVAPPPPPLPLPLAPTVMRKVEGV